MRDLEDLQSMVKDDKEAQDLTEVIEDTDKYMDEYTNSFTNLRKKISKINDDADDILTRVDFYGTTTPRPPRSEFMEMPKKRDRSPDQ